MAYITNRKARHTYEIVDTVSAGMVLLGTEVKSLRSGKGSLVGARVVIRAGEALLAGASIPPHQEKNVRGEYDKERTRILLLTKKEIEKLHTLTEAKNLTLIPLSIYSKGKTLKLDIGVGRKKLARDKRRELRERDLERSEQRGLKK